jgi:hypothetical protein
LHVMYSIGPAGVGVIVCLLAFAASRMVVTGRLWLRMKVAERRMLEHNPSAGVSPEARLFLDVMEGRRQRERGLQVSGS